MSKEIEDHATAGEALGEALQWACSPRGGNNFYGRVLNGCGRQVVKGIGTCGVTLNKRGKYIMLWDPIAFVKWKQPLQLLVIVHEAAHLVLGHLERMLRIEKDIQQSDEARRVHEVLNIAADMAVNDISIRPLVGDTRMRFHEHEKNFVWPEDRGYPQGKSFEEYAALLLADLKKHNWTPQKGGQGVPQKQQPSGKDQQKNSPGKEGGSGDNQSEEKQENKNGDSQNKKQDQGASDEQSDLPGWFQNLLQKSHGQIQWRQVFEGMSDGEIERALGRAKREAQRITKSAIEQTRKSRGTIPGSMQEALDNLLAEATIPWQIVLRGRIKSQVSQKLDESTAYPNVALLNQDEYEPYPGFQKNFTFSMLAAFDTSGSMSNDDFKDCCQELLGLLKEEDGISVRLLMFDAAIQHEADMSTDDVGDFTRAGMSRYGYGGTSFEPVLRYALGVDTESDWEAETAPLSDPLKNPDLMLLFTDGYAPVPLPELAPKCTLIWVLTSDGQANENMREILRMHD